MIRIRSKRHNFRRCGMPHPKEPVDYPDDRFSKKELAILKAEKMLIVEVIPDEPARPALRDEAGGPGIVEKEDGSDIKLEAGGDIIITAVPDIDDMTVAQIKADLDLLGIEYPDKARKAELFALYEGAKSRVE